jgi:hypothetical protein
LIKVINQKGVSSIPTKKGEIKCPKCKDGILVPHRISSEEFIMMCRGKKVQKDVSKI